MLVLARYPEAGDENEEDEQVVDRQCLLGDVAGEVLRPGVDAAEYDHADAEQHRDADVGRRPDRSLLQGRDVGLADVKDKVERQQADNRNNCHSPHPAGDVHPLPPATVAAPTPRTRSG